MPVTPIDDWREALTAAFADVFVPLFAAIPRLIAFLVILAVGWLVAGWLASAVRALLRTIQFDDLAERAGVQNVVRQMGIDTDAAGVVAELVRWAVRLVALVVAFDALGLPAVTEVLQQFLAWLPNLVVALVTLVFAGLAANALSRLVFGASTEAGFNNPAVLATVARIAVWGFGIIVAVSQIGIAETIINSLVTALVAALAVAFALAFGLGGRELAGTLVRSWYQSSQRAAQQVEAAVEAAPPAGLRSQLQQALLRRFSDMGGVWMIPKGRMPTHWQVLSEMAQDGLVEQVAENADTVIYQLPQHAA